MCEAVCSFQHRVRQLQEGNESQTKAQHDRSTTRYIVNSDQILTAQLIASPQGTNIDARHIPSSSLRPEAGNTGAPP